jgi:hypothetical protein
MAVKRNFCSDKSGIISSGIKKAIGMIFFPRETISFRGRCRDLSLLVRLLFGGKAQPTLLNITTEDVDAVGIEPTTFPSR